MKMYTERPKPLCKGILSLTLIVVLPLLMTACGSSIGSIHVEDVNATIDEAELAIEQARQVNAAQYAPKNLNKAESIVSKSKEALSEKKGLEALRYAHEAQSEAKIAEIQALQIKLKEVEIDAIKRQKEAELGELQSDLNIAQIEEEKSRTRVLELESEIRKLEREMRGQLDEANSAKRVAERDYQDANSKLVEMQKEYQILKAELRRTRDDQLSAENRVNELSQEVQQLSIKLRDAEKRAEYAQAREKVKSQAYSQKIDKIAHEKKLRETEYQARKYASQLPQRPSLTGKTNLSKDEIEMAQQTVATWYRAWKSKSLSLHLKHYTTDAVTEKNTIKSGKTVREILTRAMLNSALKRGIQETWEKTGSKVIPEKDNLIAVYQFNRPSQDSIRNRSNLYDVWIREAWFHQVGKKWKIYKEYWSFYKGVPKYPTYLGR